MVRIEGVDVDDSDTFYEDLDDLKSLVVGIRGPLALEDPGRLRLGVRLLSPARETHAPRVATLPISLCVLVRVKRHHFFWGLRLPRGLYIQVLEDTRGHAERTGWTQGSPHLLGDAPRGRRPSRPLLDLLKMRAL